MVFGIKQYQDQIFCLTEERDYFQTKFLEQVSEIAALKDELTRSKKEIIRLRNELMQRDERIVTEQEEPQEDEEQEEEHVQQSQQPQPQRTVDVTPVKKVPHTTTNPVEVDQTTSSSLTSSFEEEEEDEEEERSKSEDNKRNDDDDDGEKDEAQDIRQSAERLLQWASYRTSGRASLGSATPDHSSVASPSSLRSSFSNGFATNQNTKKHHHPLLGKTISASVEEEDQDGAGTVHNDDDDDDDDDNDNDDDSVTLPSPNPSRPTLLDRFEAVVNNL